MSGIGDLATAALRRLDAETAHDLALAALRHGLVPACGPDDPRLATTLAGLALPNPIGLAAGFDKNAAALGGLTRLGFGFVECGSVTPRPQPGTPKPRLFRLTEDRAVINRMGFNNAGLEVFAANLARRPAGLVTGANLGANKESEDRAADYVAGLRRLRGLSDYFTINISSPNTPGLRALQGRDQLDDLLGRAAAARGRDPVPLFLKIAPDLSPDEIAEIVAAAAAHGLDGVIVSNTTLDRPADLRSAHAGESGGLSGRPLRARAEAALEAAAAANAGRLTLIAAGGIESGRDVLDRLKSGASAVQFYSALVYGGPGLVRRLKQELLAALAAEGFADVRAVVGPALTTR
ncbi:MAG: quinone-dependent dihydroorotate dehydrogenase [Brevundimonas sp.]|uniref:quinone-dependent dihydroorotate dehydrogenase n=1 Tax=Brevundimonas sp. TaxID=1871086 RepID=UPI00391DAB48